mgnify:CR=1 FL=1
MKILNLLSSAITGVRDQVQASQREADRLRARRKELGLLPLPKSDVIAGVLEYIDARAADWQDEALPNLLKNFMTQSSARLDIPVLESNGAYSEVGKVFPGAMYGLFGDAIKDALRSRIEAMPWPSEVGPSRAGRRAEMAKIDAELAELESGLKKLRTDARAVGVDLDAASKS